MPNIDVKKLLDPTGPEMQSAIGPRSAGRVAVTVHWNEIESALKSGLSIADVYRSLHKAGVVSVTRQAFTRQVKARREGAGRSGTAGEPAALKQPSAATAAASVAPSSEASASAGPNRSESAEKRPGIPHRPWRTGPYKPPDPNAVFRPRDPLAED